MNWLYVHVLEKGMLESREYWKYSNRNHICYKLNPDKVIPY